MVTGGAGFIGSNLVEELVRRGHDVVVVDNFSTGKAEWVPYGVAVVNTDIQKLGSLYDCETVIHLQGHADVRHGIENLELDFQQNVLTTKALLNLCKKAKHVLFSSSATVYGDAEIIPTPEDYTGSQTSIYGAHKLACEAMIQAYSSYFGFKWHIFRFVSFTGNHYHHGVVADFVKKLKTDPKRLAILGSGEQVKSYLDVCDGVRAMLSVMDQKESGIYNIGHFESMRVFDVANIVCDEMKMNGGFIVPDNHDRAWVGDAPIVKLDCSKLNALGWSPLRSIEESIRGTVRWLLKQ